MIENSFGAFDRDAERLALRSRDGIERRGIVGAVAARSDDDVAAIRGDIAARPVYRAPHPLAGTWPWR